MSVTYIHNTLVEWREEEVVERKREWAMSGRGCFFNSEECIIL